MSQQRRGVGLCRRLHRGLQSSLTVEVMPVSRRRNHGFTLLEMAVVLAIVVVLATLAAVALGRARPRANLATASNELYALFRNARQNAMTTGRNTVVMVFPQYQNPVGGGRAGDRLRGPGRDLLPRRQPFPTSRPSTPAPT